MGECHHVASISCSEINCPNSVQIKSDDGIQTTYPSIITKYCFKHNKGGLTYGDPGPDGKPARCPLCQEGHMIKAQIDPNSYKSFGGRIPKYLIWFFTCRFSEPVKFGDRVLCDDYEDCTYEGLVMDVLDNGCARILVDTRTFKDTSNA